MKRTFIAIKIPLKKNALELIQEIKNEFRDEKIKWVESWNVHITLHFFGDTDENKIVLITEKLKQAVINLNSFQLNITGLGLFGPIKDPKVIWLGIQESTELQLLKKNINNALIELDFKIDEKPFKPHLTLGRIRFLKDESKLKDLLEKFSNKNFDTVDIDKVIFYESQLTQKGPIYKVISEYLLS